MNFFCKIRRYKLPRRLKVLEIQIMITQIIGNLDCSESICTIKLATIFIAAISNPNTTINIS